MKQLQKQDQNVKTKPKL